MLYCDSIISGRDTRVSWRSVNWVLIVQTHNSQELVSPNDNVHLQFIVVVVVAAEVLVARSTYRAKSAFGFGTATMELGR